MDEPILKNDNLNEDIPAPQPEPEEVAAVETDAAPIEEAPQAEPTSDSEIVDTAEDAEEVDEDDVLAHAFENYTEEAPKPKRWPIVVLSVLLYKTRFGLRLRSCGENPQAADSLGINVYKMRYAGTTISGALAGMGGFVYSLTTANCTANGDVAGFGFLALAVMIFGNWTPLNIAGASLLFGLFKCVAAAYSSIDINGDGVYLLAQLGISSHLYRMLPYLVTLAVLAFTSKKSRAPKAEGIPYDKGTR